MKGLIARHPARYAAILCWVGLAGLNWFSNYLLLALSTLPLIAFAFRRKDATERKSRARAPLAVLAVVALVFGVFAATATALSFLGLERHNYERVEAEALVLVEPKTKGEFAGTAATVQLLSVAGKPVSSSPIGLLGHPAGTLEIDSSEAPRLRQGDQVKIEGLFVATMLPVEVERERFRIKVESIEVQHHATWAWLSDIRQNFAKLSEQSGFPGAGLVLGLTTGDKSELAPELSRQMRDIGLSHLVAVSGANCAIVIGSIWLLIGRTRLRRSTRTAIGLLALAGYVAVVGPEPSVLRASVMIAFVFFGTALGRKVNPVDAIASAVICLLLFDPWLAVEVGFALSVLATLGLLVLAPELSRRLSLRLPAWLALPIALVVATQVACLPVLISLGSKVGLSSIFANLIAAPLVAPVTVLGMLSFVLAALGLGLAAVPFSIAAFFATPVVGVAEVLSNPALTGIDWLTGPTGLLVALVISVAIATLLLSKRANQRRLAAFGFAVCSAILAASTLVLSPLGIGVSIPSWSVFACDVGQGDAFVLKSESQIAVIDAGPDPDKVNDCLTALGIQRIDLFVSTHFDRDHIGGLDGVLKNRTIRRTLISSFEDSRPAAKQATERLRDFSSEVIEAAAGQRDSFGSGSYLVLNPQSKESFFEDANDASVSLLFWFDGIQALFLADLGERGQMRITPELLGNFQNQKCSILKVAHHGSADFYQELYEELSFDLAMVSVGKGNGYGHPTKRALEALERAGVTAARTDEHGWFAASCDRSDANPTIKTLTVTGQR